jgi:hypothetical protein
MKIRIRTYSLNYLVKGVYWRNSVRFSKCVSPWYSSTLGRILIQFGLRSVQPRDNIPRLAQTKEVSPELLGRFARIDAAHLVCLGFLP